MNRPLLVLFIVMLSVSACSESKPAGKADPAAETEKLQGVILEQQLKALEKAKEVEDVMKARAAQLDEKLKNSQ